MKFKKTLLTAFCFFLLTLWATHVFIISDKEDSTLIFRLLVTSAIVLIPLTIGLIVCIFKRKLFYVVVWVSTVLVFGFFVYIIYFVPDTSEAYYPRDHKAALKHFKNKAGFFTNYSPVVLFNEDFQKDKTARPHIVKHIYRLGGRHLENYYMGKVLVDSNFTVVKEFYDVKVVDDTSLLRQEFGKTLSDIAAVKRVMDYR